jgi:hypothetical protein
MVRKRSWRAWLPEPFWWTLLALLGVALLVAIPFSLVGALIWPNATGSTAALVFAVGYLLAIPVTWSLLRDKRR